MAIVSPHSARSELRRLIGFVLQIRAGLYWIAGIPTLLIPSLTVPARIGGFLAIAAASGLPLITRGTGRYTGVRLSAFIDILVAYVIWLAVPSADGFSLLLTIWAVASVVFLAPVRTAERVAIVAISAELSKAVLILVAPSIDQLSGSVHLVRPEEIGLAIARSGAILGIYVVLRTVNRYIVGLNVAAESGSERYRSLLDKAPTAFLTVVHDRVSYANDAARDLLEAHGREPIGRRFSSLVAESQQTDVSNRLERALGRLETIELTDLIIETTSGEQRPVDASMTAIDVGSDVAVQVALIDRSAQREAERELKRSEIDFRSFFERIPVPLYRSRPDGTILETNAALVRLLGATSGHDFVGRNAHSFYVNPADRENLTSMLGDEGMVVGYEAEMQRIDGTTMWVRDTSLRIETESGWVNEGSMVDVTERHNIEAELWSRAVQQEAAASIGQLALEAEVVTDVMVSVTETVSKVLGTEGTVVLERSMSGEFEMQGATSSLGLSPEVVAVVADRAHMTAAPVVLSTEAEVRSAAPDLADSGVRSAVAVIIPGADLAFGSLVVVSTEERRFTAEDLNFLHSVANVLAAAVDRASANARLEDLLRSKDAFVASVSHELRTPLTVVSGIAYEMCDRWDEFSPDEMNEFTNLLVEQSRDMSNLIDDLLIAARSNIGNVSVLSEPVDLESEVCAVIAGFAQGRSQKIETSLEAGVVDADPIRVRQILRNLLTNAFRYGGPNVEVRMSSTPGAVAVEVVDDGDGIPEADRDRIFLAYERAHSVPGQPGSVGIGLTVSRALAELMGGSLTYRLTDRSVFTLELPRDLSEES